MMRGILEPAGKFTDPKHEETYRLTNQTSYLNTQKLIDLEEEGKTLNHILITNTEQKIDIEYDPNTINYKHEILLGYQLTNDTFKCEIGEGLDYEQNPAEPSEPTKTANIAPYDKIF